jgi:formylmethanofuran:tetrahydromethanopterin formyltransferase
VALYLVFISQGINSIMRKLARTMTTTVQLVKKSETDYSLNSTILLLTTSQKFKLGEEKSITTTDGRKVTNVFTIEGNKLIEKQLGEKDLIIERLFFDEQLIVTSTIGSVVCTSWCKLVE